MNNTTNCLFCYEPLLKNELDFHMACCKKFFGANNSPEMSYKLADLNELAKKTIQTRAAVAGVQPKLSFNITKESSKDKTERLTLIGLKGNFILKPLTQSYASLPEIEDLTMHLAAHAKIKTLPHSLIRLRSSELAYITKRIDRDKTQKVHMEDMCQLSERLTEDKYKGSQEAVGKLILKYSSNAGFDALAFFELTVFCFLTGNADMHLKNFSLLQETPNKIGLAPAYDLVATKLLMKDLDKEEMALTLNGKKNRLKLADFNALAESLKINSVAKERAYKRLASALPKMMQFINLSFLNSELKQEFKELLKERSARLELAL
jgi:serine/threonine-protein kinase HipA